MGMMRDPTTIIGTAVIRRAITAYLNDLPLDPMPTFDMSTRYGQQEAYVYSLVQTCVMWRQREHTCSTAECRLKAQVKLSRWEAKLFRWEAKLFSAVRKLNEM